MTSTPTPAQGPFSGVPGGIQVENVDRNQAEYIDADDQSLREISKLTIEIGDRKKRSRQPGVVGEDSQSVQDFQNLECIDGIDPGNVNLTQNIKIADNGNNMKIEENDMEFNKLGRLDTGEDHRQKNPIYETS